MNWARAPPQCLSVLSGNLARGGKFGTIFMAMGGWPIWGISLGDAQERPLHWRDLPMAYIHAESQNDIHPAFPSFGRGTMGAAMAGAALVKRE